MQCPDKRVHAVRRAFAFIPLNRHATHLIFKLAEPSQMPDATLLV
jgi:hypothetical protein